MQLRLTADLGWLLSHTCIYLFKHPLSQLRLMQGDEGYPICHRVRGGYTLGPSHCKRAVLTPASQYMFSFTGSCSSQGDSTTVPD